MKMEDELRVRNLVADYMCWWDDRLQNKDYPTQLDNNATWEVWLHKGTENVLLAKFQGKQQILASKPPDSAIIHSTSNFVFRDIDDDHVEVRAYFRTYFRNTGHLFSHGEGRYQISRVNGEWRMMSILNQDYWFYDKRKLIRMGAAKGAGLIVVALLMGLAGAKLFS